MNYIIENDSPYITESDLIKEELYYILNKKISEIKPDKLIVIERKGTATLRALIETKIECFGLDWKDIISSNSLDQYSAGALKNKKIIIFDEMMRFGTHLTDEILNLFKYKLISEDDLKFLYVIVFAAHEDAPENIKICIGEKNYALYYYAYYKNLYHKSYIEIREYLVTLLQRSGSLLLDTEHIGIRIKLKGNLLGLIEALSRKAEVALFRTSFGKNNITVLYDDSESHLIDEDDYPPNSIHKQIVKKVRFIERDDDEYELIPIQIPDVPVDVGEWDYKLENQELLGTCTSKNGKYFFYATSLLSSIEVLKWVFKDLNIWGTDNFQIIFPSLEIDESNFSYTLNHLRATYPTIKLEKLMNKIKALWNTAKKEANEIRDTKFKYSKYEIFETEKLRKYSIQMLQVIREILDEKKNWNFYFNKSEKDFNEIKDEGLTVSEIFEIGKRKELNFSDILISTIFDVLINEANLVTSVEKRKDSSGLERYTRTFVPDSEIISEEIRKYTATWGLPINEF